MLYFSWALSSLKYNSFRSKVMVEVDSPSLLGSTFNFLFWSFAVVGVDTTNALETFFDFKVFGAIDGLERVMRG